MAGSGAFRAHDFHASSRVSRTPLSGVRRGASLARWECRGSRLSPSAFAGPSRLGFGGAIQRAGEASSRGAHVSSRETRRAPFRPLCGEGARRESPETTHVAPVNALWVAPCEKSSALAVGAPREAPQTGFRALEDRPASIRIRFEQGNEWHSFRICMAFVSMMKRMPKRMRFVCQNESGSYRFRFALKRTLKRIAFVLAFVLVADDHPKRMAFVSDSFARSFWAENEWPNVWQTNRVRLPWVFAFIGTRNEWHSFRIGLSVRFGLKTNGIRTPI